MNSDQSMSLAIISRSNQEELYFNRYSDFEKNNVMYISNNLNFVSIREKMLVVKGGTFK
jgi:hypothetical protein